MKKSYFLITAILLASSAIIAQPILTSTNFILSVNDNQMYYVADTNSVLDNTTGSNVIFNYTNLGGYGMTQNQYIVNPSTTTYGAGFPSASYADTTDATASNIRYAESFAPDSLNNIGFSAQVPGYGIVVAQYNTDPEVLMEFPFTYGDAFIDPYAGTFSMQGQNTDGQGSATVQADAWGQLQLPFGVTIDSVLRVTTSEYVITDTIFITFPPITLNPIEITGTYINYYKPSISKFPLLSYVTGTIKQDGNIVDSSASFISQYPLINLSVGQEEIVNSTEFSLYPNPSNKETVTLGFNLEKGSNLKVELRNNLGQKVETIYNDQAILGKNQFEINTQTLTAGVYFVNVTIDGTLSTKKLIIQ